MIEQSTDSIHNMIHALFLQCKLLANQMKRNEVHSHLWSDRLAELKIEEKSKHNYYNSSTLEII